jgi:hypothetical protein
VRRGLHGNFVFIDPRITLRLALLHLLADLTFDLPYPSAGIADRGPA